jgi:hypothetical protein
LWIGPSPNGGADLYAALTSAPASPSRTLTRTGAILPAVIRGRRFMLDLAYLALGLGVLALFGVYAAALRRL